VAYLKPAFDIRFEQVDVDWRWSSEMVGCCDHTGRSMTAFPSGPAWDGATEGGRWLALVMNMHALTGAADGGPESSRGIDGRVG